MKCSKCNRVFESEKKLCQHQKRCNVQVVQPAVMPTPAPVVTTPVVPTPVVSTTAPVVE